MQNIRGRARRRARVHFNLASNRVRSETPEGSWSDDKGRAEAVNKILARIKESEQELTSCENQSGESLNMPEDALTNARIKHEEYLLDDLIEYIENSLIDALTYKARLKRNLIEWILRNETELKEIDELENLIMKRYVEITKERQHMQRLLDFMRALDNLENDFDNLRDKIFALPISISTTQSSSLESKSDKVDIKL
ncbi:unnamed protein product [Thelazia callipaeda]|uniref:BMERB domain-containing protein n=1 Tax=Thelazia callipaeda TaxID=103827 RepID=A0A0N5CSS3_THECL|nr:unnamed protein product [Thelazia callipaeda]